MRSHRTNLLLVGIALGIFAASAMRCAAQMTDEQLARFFGYDAPHPEQLRHFRLGGVVALNMKAKFSMGGNFVISGNDPGPVGTPNQNHVYDDGFVKIDATGNDGELTSEDGGLTWNWGYQNADQFHADSQRLFFHSSASFSANQSSSVDGGPQPGVEIAYGGNITRVFKSALLGWEFGFAYLPVSIQDRQTTTATVTRNTYSFDARLDKFPDAPYQGTFNGPGALIGDVAQLEGSTTTNALVSGGRTLNVDMFTFRLGPTLHWELHPRIAVAVSAGGALGLLSGELQFDESIEFPDGTKSPNKGSSSSTELVYGGYIGGTVMYHAVPNGDFYIGVQYMPLTEATFQGVNREARLSLTGGIYFSAGVNWPF